MPSPRDTPSASSASSARNKLVASTIDLLRRQGVAGTGIAALLEHSGVARRTLYLNFPGGKTELITVATQSAGNAIAAMMESILEKGHIEDGLAAFVAWRKDVLVTSDFSAGCPIAAAALGRAEAAPAADAAAATFAQWEKLVSSSLVARGVDERAAASLAIAAIAALEGAVVVCVAKRDTATLDRVHRHLGELVELHLGHR